MPLSTWRPLRSTKPSGLPFCEMKDFRSSPRRASRYHRCAAIIFAAVLSCASVAHAAAAEPTIEPLPFAEAIRGQEIAVSGDNLPTAPNAISVVVGQSRATASAPDATKFTFRVPPDAPLGQQVVTAEITSDNQKRALPLTAKISGEVQRFIKIHNNQPGALTLEAVAPLVSYPVTGSDKAPDHFEFRVLGTGFSRRGPDNHLEIEKQGEIRVRWDQQPDATEELDRKQFDARGFVLSDRELQIRDLMIGDHHQPMKIRVRVGDDITPPVPITLSTVGRATPFWISLGVVIVLLAVVAWITAPAARKALANGDGTVPDTRVGFFGRFLLDRETATYSLSRFQFYIWTFVGIFGYCFLTVSRSLVQGHFELADIPAGLPGIIGVAAGTSVLANGITTAHGTKGAGEFHPAWSDLIVSGGVVAPERFQFLVWTIIGALSFLFDIVASDPGDLQALPAIPQGFLALMGISSAGYLGGKLARQPGPVIDSVIAEEGSLKLEVRGRNLARNATYRIGDHELTYSFKDDKPQEGADRVAKEAVVTILTKEDDANAAAFAKAVLIVIDNPKDEWLKPDQKLTVINADGQRAVWDFTAKLKAPADPPQQTEGATVEEVRAVAANWVTAT